MKAVKHNIFKTDIRRTFIARAMVALMVLLVGSLQGQTLDAYIGEALRENPGIKSAEAKYMVSSEKISEATTWSNTEFGAGYSVGQMEMGMMPKAEFSAMQMVPWFGLLGARKNYATAVADADYVGMEIAQKNLILSVKQSYYRLYGIKAKQKVFDLNIRLLKTYERMALTSVEVGKTSAVSVLRLQMRQNDLVEKKLILQQEFEAEKQVFEKLLNRETSQPLAIPDTLTISPHQEIERDIDLHPELVKFEKLNRAIALSEKVNRKESVPQLGVGAEYMLFAENPDMVMPMVSLSIPIFNKKHKSVSRQNELRQQEIQYQKKERRNDLKSNLAKAISQREQAQIKFETQIKNLQQAKNAEKILIKNYETGTIDFNDVLDIQELQLKFQIDYIESVKNYYIQSAIINYLTN
ncbi:TolC family protein [Aequorivita todarodis]|uniref:TolC family protein n=1 Tax=Aequorivita todarodis TaxID=2036821 RepID=UPI002350177F|nr:TolC family protein [Aequorivita todarodis]MDC8000826.1 TolC family protein [Aequorivita todarodis]